MGKLWLIIYTGTGLIGGSAGPLPYDMAECRERAAEMQAKANAKPDIAKGMHFECEFRDTRPEITEGRP